MKIYEHTLDNIVAYQIHNYMDSNTRAWILHSLVQLYVCQIAEEYYK